MAADPLALLAAALPHCYLAAGQTVQCPECNALWWGCAEELDEDWHAAGCKLHQARVLVGQSVDVRRRTADEPDRPYQPNGPAPDPRTPAQVLRDTVLDGVLSRIVRARYEAPPAGVERKAWEASVGAVVDLLVREAPPARGGYSSGGEWVPAAEGPDVLAELVRLRERVAELEKTTGE